MYSHDLKEKRFLKTSPVTYTGVHTHIPLQVVGIEWEKAVQNIYCFMILGLCHFFGGHSGGHGGYSGGHRGEDESFVLFQDGVTEHDLVMVSDGGKHLYYSGQTNLGREEWAAQGE